MLRRTLLPLALLVLPWPVALLAGGATAPAPEAELEALDGSVRRVPLAGLDVTRMGGDGPALVRVVGLDRRPSDLEEGERCVVRLVGGDRVAGRVSGGEGETLELRVAGVRLPIGIDRLVGLEWPSRVPADFADRLGAPEEGDRLYRVSGAALDVVDGAVVAFAESGVTFDGVLGTKTFAWDEVAALFLEVFVDEAGVGDEPEGTRVVCDLASGSRLGGRFEALRPSGLQLALSGGLRVALPIAEVLEVVVDDGSLVFLSDVEPTAEPKRGSPFDDGGMTWPHRADLSCEGRPMAVGGRPYHRGIGVHAPSELAYSLDGSKRTLRGAVGVDDSVLRGPRAARGEVRFRVLGDGRELWASDVVRGGDAAVPFGPLDLAGVRELRLVVDPLEHFMGDRANWLRVLLVR